MYKEKVTYISCIFNPNKKFHYMNIFTIVNPNLMYEKHVFKSNRRLYAFYATEWFV